ncbi:DUF2157 domain-containing protein [Angustibacter sp. Root456]|uniref:DUF2157 domain-containing protein n=1 Tax=Angustibacter sp. Root456 TaxID=1736539 RepID=UPI0006F61797|nr:DUF2157 domain-containing protein [Angustibacter sp. Root456]KQX61673.1 hypothetical protein ASD06_13830 [Angustibacter sp. Root456]
MDDVLHRAQPTSAAAEEVALLERWVAAGYISRSQAELIREAERGETPPAAVEPHPSEHATSLVLEALGYLGGVLMVTASALLVGQFWDELSRGVRTGLMLAVWMVLVGAGLAVPQWLGRQGSRVRSVLWLAGAIALAVAFGLVAGEWWHWGESSVASWVACGVTGQLAVLWWRERSALLQAGLVVGVVASVLALLTRFTTLEGPGLGVAVGLVGLAWWVLGARGLVTPRRAATVLGPAVTVLGAVMASMADWGLWLGLATVAGLVVLAVRWRDLWLLVIAGAGSLELVPRVVEEWFPGRLAVPVILLVTGLVMVLAAVRIARRAATPAAGVAPRSRARRASGARARR